MPYRTTPGCALPGKTGLQFAHQDFICCQPCQHRRRHQPIQQLHGKSVKSAANFDAHDWRHHPIADRATGTHRAFQRIPAPYAIRGQAHLDAYARQGLARVAQQPGKQHRVGPPVHVLPDHLRRSTAREDLASPVVERKQCHFKRLDEGAGRIRTISGFSRWQGLQEFRVATDDGTHDLIEHLNRKAELGSQ